MKALVADVISSEAISALQSAGLNVLYLARIQGEAFVQAITDFNPEVLVVRSKKVSADVIAAASSLELIVRAGAGYDNIDTAEASRRGIFVANCPGKNSIAVAEFTLGLILAVDRKLADAVSSLKAGKWTKGDFANCKGLKGRSLGIVGFGYIGQEVARRALSFGLKVLIYDVNINHRAFAELGIQSASSLDELFAQSDILTFHVPSTPTTKGIINAGLLNKTKPDVVIINTSRGDLVDEPDFLEGLEAHPEVWYACDVLKSEPAAKSIDFVHALVQHPRVYATPHIGASTRQAEAAIGEEALRVILQYASTRKLDRPNCVNLNKTELGTHSLAVRYTPRAGIVAEVLNALSGANATVFDLSNSVLLGAASASLRISFKTEATEPLDTIRSDVESIAGVIQVVLLGNS